MPTAASPKYRQIVEAIRQDLVEGAFAPGEKLPSDAQLAARFGTSRLTVIRALRQLAEVGVVHRRAGSGTYVGPDQARPPAGRTFGLLIPDLGEGEIFEPICQGMARAGRSLHHSLLWGNSSFGENVSVPDDKSVQAGALCEYFIERRVDGVFFAPLELAPYKDDTNLRIASRLQQSGIPVVLLDRCFLEYPERSGYDLIGIDNQRAGFRMTGQLLRAGCTRIGFLVRPGSAQTVDARIAGFAKALDRQGIARHRDSVLRAEPSDASVVLPWIESIGADGIVCANDFTAAHLMQTLLANGIDIPGQMKIVGFDDVKYASLLSVPLTTLRQPCQEIGAEAVRVMSERIANPNAPARDILLDCKIIVRQSCGGACETMQQPVVRRPLL
jgi:GntR family transcriptional regulator of arabinose operon